MTYNTINNGLSCTNSNTILGRGYAFADWYFGHSFKKGNTLELNRTPFSLLKFSYGKAVFQS